MSAGPGSRTRRGGESVAAQGEKEARGNMSEKTTTVAEPGLTSQPTRLEREGDAALPDPGAIAGTFAAHPNPHPASAERYAEEMRKLAFGKVFSDNMAVMHWSAGEGWHDREIRAYGAQAWAPGSTVLHYGQEVFEGLKVYRRADGSLWTFRPGYNAARMNHSARRLALPEIDRHDFLASLVDLVHQDARWVPTLPSTLYLRPVMFADEEFLGVHPASRVAYYLIASPSGPYFAHGFQPVSIWVTRKYHRTGPGGTGDCKTAGNYAASLLPQQYAQDKGFEQVCFVDAVEQKYLEELGGMNLFVVTRDGRVHTPALTGTILPGNTRSAIARILRSEGTPVLEENLALDDVVAGVKSGEVSEIFACGTAAVVTPIGRLAGQGFDVEVPTGPVTKHAYERLTAIQDGTAPDPFGWTWRIA